jgi:6-bladed beta-propeller/NHL repeat
MKALAIIVLACTPALAAGARPVGPGPVWPPAPDVPRVVFVRSVAGPSDVGVRPSSIGRLGRWIAGGDAGYDGLRTPVGVAAGADGSVCVADTGAAKIFLYEPRRARWMSWDHAGPLKFQAPVAVALTDGEIFAVDTALGAVFSFNTSGEIVREIKHVWGRPTGLALLGERLYVADVAHHSIEVFDKGGAFVKTIGRRGEGPGEFNFPTHLAAAGDRLLVTDALNSRVQVFDTDGRFISSIGGPGDTSGRFGRPKGVAVDAFGHVYVADAVFDNVQVFDLEGRLLLNLGAPGTGPGEFGLPGGLAVGPDNHIFVADACNHRIQELQYVRGP